MKQIIAIIGLFGLMGVFSACEGGRGGGDTKAQTHSDTDGLAIDSNMPLDAVVKIYFENTLSMDGYINGNTGFKNVFRDLLVAVENEDDIDFSTEFYLINDKLIQTDFGVETTKISEELNPRNTAGKGNKGSNDFEEVLDRILENQEGDAISIIMADFIYSPWEESNVPSALGNLKTYTQDA
jgi:hypothetical protein